MIRWQRFPITNFLKIQQDATLVGRENKILEINQKHLKRFIKYSVFTIPKNMNYSGYKTIIPNKFIGKYNYERFINLPDDQPIKIKKQDDVKIIKIGELKKCRLKK